MSAVSVDAPFDIEPIVVRVRVNHGRSWPGRGDVFVAARLRPLARSEVPGPGARAALRAFRPVPGQPLPGNEPLTDVRKKPQAAGGLTSSAQFASTRTGCSFATRAS